MGKFESYPSINTLSDDDITLYNHNTETRKVTFLGLANCIKERVADPIPMPYSTNLVRSGGIYEAIQDAMASKADKATTLAGYGIQDAYTMSDCDVRFMQEYDIDSTYWDNEPTEDSHKPVISGGIYDAIQDATTDMVGATANDDGARGLVPQPLAGDENKVLRGDGTWGDAASSVSDLTDVNLTSLSDKQLLRYNNTSSKWENISSDTTPTQNSTNPITSGGVYDAIQSFSTNFVGTLAEWNTLTPAEQAEYKTKDITDDYNGLPIDAVPTQSSVNPVSSGGTYEALANKVNTSDVANNLTTTASGKVLDARQGKTLNDAKAEKSDLASISITGSTNNTGSTIYAGTFFYKDGELARAKVDIANGATLTLNTNYEKIIKGGLNIDNNVTGTTVSFKTYNTEANKYQCPYDGYVTFNSTSASSGDASFNIYDANGTYICSKTIRVVRTFHRDGLFVKKGFYLLCGDGSTNTNFAFEYHPLTS